MIRSLRLRLIVILACILISTQAGLVYWLWHESSEQVTILVTAVQTGEFSPQELESEVHEAIRALIVPSLIQCGLSLLAAYIAISWIVEPLKRLTRSLRARTPDNLEPVELRDTSEEIQAVSGALNELLARLDLAIHRERQFTADVAHELRTPLAGIRLNLELMEADGVEGIRQLVARLDRLHQTVEQLLNMARMERKFILGLQTRMELAGEVVSPMRDEVKALLLSGGKTARYQLSPCVVNGDAELLRTMLRNLIENCACYADPGTEVQIRLAQEGEWACLVITDQGPGVPEAQLARLTDAFRRLDQRGGGVGLGLNIVARICALHQGRLAFTNRDDGRGLVATIRIPLAVHTA